MELVGRAQGLRLVLLWGWGDAGRWQVYSSPAPSCVLGVQALTRSPQNKSSTRWRATVYETSHMLGCPPALPSTACISSFATRGRAFSTWNLGEGIRTRGGLVCPEDGPVPIQDRTLMYLFILWRPLGGWAWTPFSRTGRNKYWISEKFLPVGTSMLCYSIQYRVLAPIYGRPLSGSQSLLQAL